MNIKEMPHAVRLWHFVDTLRGLRDLGQVITQDRADALARDWDIEPIDLSQAEKEQAAAAAEQVKACADWARRQAARGRDARGVDGGPLRMRRAF